MKKNIFENILNDEITESFSSSHQLGIAETILRKISEKLKSGDSNGEYTEKFIEINADSAELNPLIDQDLSDSPNDEGMMGFTKYLKDLLIQFDNDKE